MSPPSSVNHQNGSRSESVVRIAVVQMRAAVAPNANIDRAIALIGQAARQGAQIICLQELFAARYPCQSEDHAQFDLAEPLTGSTVAALQHTAAQHEVVLIGPFFERRAAGVYHNSACVIDADGSIAGLYRKMHIPDDPLYYEKFYFAPGDLGFQAFETRYAQVGVCICWDQWFPEAARLTCLAGAEILFFPTAIGWLHDEKAEFGRQQHTAWETMIRSHAIANGVFVATPNRVGVEGGLEFWGASFVANPQGEILARASHDQEEVLLADCLLPEIEATRTHWPFFRDRRIDAYHDLSRRYRDPTPGEGGIQQSNDRR